MKFPVQDAIVRPPIWDHIRPDVAALGADDAVGKGLDGGLSGRWPTFMIAL
jgi:hypothetical protein